nr:hypothetical protein 6 [Bacillaceae bacterium]
MKKQNKALWTKVEGLANEFVSEKDDFKKEMIFAELFDSMQKYVSTCANNAVRKAGEFHLHIPKDDFTSAFNLALWQSIEAFDPTKGKFKSLVSYRFRIAEATVWRMYETKDENEKDGRSFEKARWDSLDKKIGGGDGESETTFAELVVGDTPSVEETFIEDNGVVEILKAFAEKNERYAKVIAAIYEGYEGDDLAKAIGEGEKYNAKVRKLVQRAKDSFAKFMAEVAVA